MTYELMSSRNQGLGLNKKQIGESHTLLLSADSKCSNHLLHPAQVIFPVRLTGCFFLSSSGITVLVSFSRPTAARRWLSRWTMVEVNTMGILDGKSSCIAWFPGIILTSVRTITCPEAISCKAWGSVLNTNWHALEGNLNHGIIWVGKDLWR